MVKRVGWVWLRFFYGALFITSAIIKLFPIEAFELVLIRQLDVSWALAPFMARGIIAVEFALGACIVFGFQTKGVVWGSLAMLAGFTVHLVVLAATGAGSENCGCFGELIPMDAPASIAKNLLFAAIALVLLWKIEQSSRFSFGFGGLVAAYFFIPVVFALLPLPEGVLSKEATINSVVMTEVNNEVSWDITTGEKVVLVMYSKCVHCAQLASLISTTDHALAQEKLRMLIFGSEASLPYFLEKTATTNFPYRHTASRPLMQAMNGTVPTVIAMRDGAVVSNWTGAEVNIDLLVKLLKESPAPYAE